MGCLGSEKNEAGEGNRCVAGVAEPEGGVKSGISPESLRNHKQINSNPPWILLIFFQLQPQFCFYTWMNMTKEITILFS